MLILSKAKNIELSPRKKPIISEKVDKVPPPKLKFEKDEQPMKIKNAKNGYSPPGD